MKTENPTFDEKGSYRVMRGGGYYNSPYFLRASTRSSSSPSDRYSGGGFRLVRNR
jgi:formylglycine-generating enzyme required for sulfatase activity